MEAGHNNNVPEDIPKDLRCPLCLYHTKHKSNMIDHIVLHRGTSHTREGRVGLLRISIMESDEKTLGNWEKTCKSIHREMELLWWVDKTFPSFLGRFYVTLSSVTLEVLGLKLIKWQKPQPLESLDKWHSRSLLHPNISFSYYVVSSHCSLLHHPPPPSFPPFPPT